MLEGLGRFVLLAKVGAARESIVDLGERKIAGLSVGGGGLIFRDQTRMRSEWQNARTFSLAPPGGSSIDGDRFCV